MSMIGKIARSPLLHFFIIGAAIYASYAAFSPEAEVESPDTVIVTAGTIGWLEENWANRWNRPPSAEERRGLIDQYVRESVLYREALAMGLDKDDTIIRRRLTQKLEFLFQDLADMNVPTDEELREYFAANAERYRDPDLLTFTQVFVDPDRRGDRTLDDAEAILTKLAELEDPAEGAGDFADPFMLQVYYPERSQMEIGKLFGLEFAGSIFDLSQGEWHGPILSGYGVHLVYVHSRYQSPPASFELARDQVASDLQTERREQVNEQYYQGLLTRYEVIIEDEREQQEDLAQR
jgi:peptidyl-prolyl cis-trans isomerase C